MKKPPKPRGAAPKPQPPTSESLLAAARGHAGAGRFREAVAAFKELIRVDDRPQWRLELAAAYGGRAGELAAKGMHKEALTVWENRAQVAPDLPPEPAYFALLLRLGRVAAVAQAAGADGAGLDPDLRATLRCQLAAFHLAGDPAVSAALPADDPILTQGEAASRALDAYCGGDDAALQDALAAIPFRSPYRDLAQVLKALRRLPQDPAEAARMLARVPDDSGFAALRRGAELALGDPQTLPERLAGVNESAARFALTLLGWGERRQTLLLDYRRLGASGPKSLLRLLHRHRPWLGEEWARRQALRLLVHGFPKTAGWMAEAGWRRLCEDERLLVAAWRAEEMADAWAETDAWEAYADFLQSRGPAEPGSDGALRIALVMRRVDSHRDFLGHTTPSDDPEAIDRVLCHSVLLSLKYDPDHRETYARLARYRLGGHDLKSARAVLDLGLKRFPEDPALLAVALDLALAAGSFKKAARYAREILRLDPIDTQARERLVKAHLAHAAKQMRAARNDLAAKELEQAAEWDPGGRLRERRELLGGLLEQAQDPARGAALLGAQVKALGGGLAAAFALAREATAAGRPASAVLKSAGLSKVPVPSQGELMGFLARLRAHLDDGAGLAPELCLLVESPLKAAAHWPLARPELEGICETLRRAGLRAARLAFAQAGLARWSDDPLFELHCFESRHGEGWSRRPTARELDRLDAAWGRAREAGDMRTAHRLAELLREYHPFGFPGGAGFPRDLDDGDEDGGMPGPEGALGSGFGPGLPGPAEAFRAVIEAVGIEKILKMAGLSAADQRRFKTLERELGREAVIESLVGFLDEHGPGLPPDLAPPTRRK